MGLKPTGCLSSLFTYEEVRKLPWEKTNVDCRHYWQITFTRTRQEDELLKYS